MDEINGDNFEWFGGGGETEKHLLANEGGGRPIILRDFEFQLPPLNPAETPTKQQLLDFHRGKITAFLWRDELIPIEKEWRLVFDKGMKSFRIFVPCQAKPGSAILESPELLQDIIKPNKAS